MSSAFDIYKTRQSKDGEMSHIQKISKQIFHYCSLLRLSVVVEVFLARNTMEKTVIICNDLSGCYLQKTTVITNCQNTYYNWINNEDKMCKDKLLKNVFFFK